MKSSNIWNDLGLLIIRLGFSAAMLTHGWPKLMKLIEQKNPRFPDPLGIGDYPSLIMAVIGEIVAPILLIIGFKTRLSAIPAAATMFAALFIVHGGDPFKKQELALLYLLGFSSILIAGGGRYSVDGMLKAQIKR